MDFKHEHSELIAKQNDAFRRTVIDRPHPNGLCHMTIGFNALDDFNKLRVIAVTKDQSEFEEGNDPYGEHDFGTVDLPDCPKCFWKISYYENGNMEFGTATPQALNTYRVLTIMLAEEY